jgi:chromosome segregation ATPase
MYKQRIKTLEESYKLIEQKIANKDGDLNSLQEQKAKYHRELSELRRKQYDYDYEQLDLGDDR